MAEYIERSDAIMAVTRAELPDKTENGIPIANGKRKVTDCVRRIKAIPAADVQLVRHGKWETEICDDGYGAYNLFVCSLCGSESAKRFNYCRECGARMDGET